MKIFLLFVFWITFNSEVDGKIFSKCELAELIRNFAFTEEDTRNLVCIAYYESAYRTDAISHNPHSTDYGIFQINNLFWCGDEFRENGCDIPCEVLLDDDLTDDLACVKIIRETTAKYRRDKNGFMAWYGYQFHCRHKNLTSYLQEC